MKKFAKLFYVMVVLAGIGHATWLFTHDKQVESVLNLVLVHMFMTLDLMGTLKGALVIIDRSQSCVGERVAVANNKPLSGPYRETPNDSEKNETTVISNASISMSDGGLTATYADGSKTQIR